MPSSISAALAFVRRDFQVARSYRVPFLLDFAGALFIVVEFYFLAEIVPESASTGDYLGFVVTGLVVTTFLVSTASVITSGVRQEQLQGTLEITLSTGTSLPTLALGLAAYPLMAGAVRSTIYAVLAAALGARVPGANWGLAIAAMIVGSISFVSIGLGAVGLVLIFRQAAGAVGWLLGAATLLAGVVFPLELLPGWLRFLSGLSAATWALQTTRAAVLDGATWADGAPALVLLLAMGVVYALLAMMTLRWAMRSARRSGGLSQY
jgi:ABC-2 type transport system permease protein